MEKRWRKLYVEEKIWRKPVEGNMEEKIEISGEEITVWMSNYLTKRLF